MSDPNILVLISADAEWSTVKEILAPSRVQSTNLGETFTISPLTFFHSGWGKISTAAATQFVIDKFHPDLLVNLGTCGGFEGHVTRGTIFLVTKTIVYDIYEQMSDPRKAIDTYTTVLDLSWLPDPFPFPVHRGTLVSADRDIVAEEISDLFHKYQAVVGDWESGAVAWVAKRNRVRCLILRGVTDLVGPSGGEAYGNMGVFLWNTRLVMKTLLDQLPVWLERIL